MVVARSWWGRGWEKLFNEYKLRVRWINSRDLLYNIVLTANNAVLCCIERVDVKFGVLTTKKWGSLELLEVVVLFIILTVVIVSQMYTYVQTHLIVYTKYVKFLWINYTSVSCQIIKLKDDSKSCSTIRKKMKLIDI